MNPELLTKAKQLAARDYTVIITEDTLSDGGKIYVVEHPELPGCMAQGTTIAAAQEELAEATVDYIYYLLEDGLDVPDPLNSRTVTGGNNVPVESSAVGMNVHVTIHGATFQMDVDADTDEDDALGLKYSVLPTSST